MNGGNGYPKGLKGDEIPLPVTYHRRRGGLRFNGVRNDVQRAETLQQAVEELQNNAGTQFDYRLVSVFVDKVLAEKSIEDELCV
ncbi:hypothetical protein [Aminivibrio sp.]|uniref:hypothetical protein n=1 Tax=Aminivibrio sp. TaxID=1872489 RepID=UPI00345E55D0